ncbi:TPR-like protein [Yamadazyma tenuis ATCC 10573]|uniref:TPR-like protein n=1 Tax=Candida tenuis (strain ATCC 10573 / BCRC 21748 / CBS 615 / JCM 9827 / NBRC 10315 / NRRL Y-1498 / VKM Y-70) TaxID=590646 RepID=G3AYA6_CANTC|nr:TPR-like protein [Yamadazyma tenuis ATCC 10573]EGV65803.1 TPR-like protein [Yamadazyma tenuis ATCC 10573]
METDESIDQLRTDLLKAQITLSNINLLQASKWCAEAINGLSNASNITQIPTLEFDPYDLQDYSRFILAKSYFDVKEFDRCAHSLVGCKSGNAVFLKLYSKILSLDKKMAEENDGSDLNSKLSKIIQEIESFNSSSNPNHFLYYLLGIIYNKKRNYKLAQRNLLAALKLFPYNWSCWQELINSIIDFDEAMELLNKVKSSKSSLNPSIMFNFFEVVLLQEFYQQSVDVNQTLEKLLSIFPNFNFLKIQKFLICYHSLDYYQAESIFDQILEDDPLRIDDLDTYSNMLYVMEKKSKLSFLAQYSSNIDKFKPETCCIIANYHSMKGEHEKAIMYYKRALILNKNSLSAWTLMGHEFVELKNSHAAIESYRRAVDINPKDFRAWYGLGQAYEVLDMHLYSLYYYQRATNLQPTDKRMWQAIGNCYEKIGKFDESLKSFKKALSIDNTNKPQESHGSYDPYICYKLASIYEKIASVKECYKYMKLCFDQELDWGITDETSKARLWLARYALELKKYEEAYELTKDLNHNNAHDIEEARAIAREARNRMNK